MGNAGFFGKLFRVDRAKTPTESVLDFVRDKFLDYVKQVGTDFANKNENEITERLAIFLQEHASRAGKRFYFHHQSSDGTQGIHSNDFLCRAYNAPRQPITPQDDPSPNVILRFEAKRLTEGLAKAREKEYVVGKKGGIERFKKGVHGGRDHAAAIVGYIQRHDAAYWHPKVNGWIDEQIASPDAKELTWDQQDRLILQGTISQVTQFTSTSSRTQGNPISLSHFWLQLA